jgi:hypothetical protein
MRVANARVQAPKRRRRPLTVAEAIAELREGIAALDILTNGIELVGSSGARDGRLRPLPQTVSQRAKRELGRQLYRVFHEARAARETGAGTP